MVSLDNHLMVSLRLKASITFVKILSEFSSTSIETGVSLGNLFTIS